MAVGPVSWDNVSLPACVFSTCVGKRMATSPTSHQHYLSPFGGNAENGRYCPFPDSSDPASETLSPGTSSCTGTTGSGWASFLYALKLYELHKLSDLSALSLSHLRYFAASLIADKLSAQALADAVMAIPDLEAAALQLVDRSERRYGGVQKAFAAAGKSRCYGRK